MLKPLQDFGEKMLVSGVIPGAIMKNGHWDYIKKQKPHIMADFLKHHVQ